MIVQLKYWRAAEGWHIRCAETGVILHQGFDTKAEAEEFARQQGYEVEE